MKHAELLPTKDSTNVHYMCSRISLKRHVSVLGCIQKIVENPAYNAKTFNITRLHTGYKRHLILSSSAFLILYPVSSNSKSFGKKYFRKIEVIKNSVGWILFTEQILKMFAIQIRAFHSALLRIL